MSSNPFPESPPGTTDFTSLVSNVSQLLASDLRTRIRNELNPLKENSTPTNAERGALAYDALVGAADGLAKAKEEIEALNSFFDAAAKYVTKQLEFHSALKTYFERTTDQLALRSELVAPIRQLPNEVLQLIFLEVHAQAWGKERYNPITAQVCTFWRQLAHATPVLWTSVNVNLKGDEEDGIQAVAQMKAQIERARQQLVTVRFSMKPEEFDFSLFNWALGRASELATNIPQSSRHFKAAITTLLQHRDRVGELDIPRHEADLGGYLVTKCATDNLTFDNLHTLILYEDEPPPRDFDAKPLLKACPNVRHLRIYEAPDTPDIHWESMKEFKGNLKTAALTAFLSRAQDVEQAEIGSSHWHNVSNITFSDRLTALSLDSGTITLATLPRPPGLQYLALSEGYDSALTLLRSWGSDLRFLAISFDITAKNMKNLLPAVPGLQCFRLCGDRATPPNLFNLLPKLTHIEIRTGVDSFSEEPVRRLLSRPLKHAPRAKQSIPLRSVAFLPRFHKFYDDLDMRVDEFEGVWEGLYQDLKATGIEVHEYRTRKTVHNPAFNTAFFQEHWPTAARLMA